MTYQPKGDRFPQLTNEDRKKSRTWLFERSDHLHVEREPSLVYVTPRLAVPADWSRERIESWRAWAEQEDEHSSLAA